MELGHRGEEDVVFMLPEKLAAQARNIGVDGTGNLGCYGNCVFGNEDPNVRVLFFQDATWSDRNVGSERKTEINKN